MGSKYSEVDNVPNAIVMVGCSFILVLLMYLDVPNWFRIFFGAIMFGFVLATFLWWMSFDKRDVALCKQEAAYIHDYQKNNYRLRNEILALKLKKLEREVYALPRNDHE